ncbi:uncharacterized protein LOC122052105 isoform X1 [Zingiber officinale]|uniref:uncharacterized protein LOC122052105 isoform X1 n=1 Tax=Zingiber officinale TaxID=94328 RepID=UPI001C4AB6E0|nr:uncharacterized protein LOC122052105 isoform X1 [Zingiber officinale]
MILLVSLIEEISRSGREVLILCYPTKFHRKLCLRHLSKMLKRWLSLVSKCVLTPSKISGFKRSKSFRTTSSHQAQKAIIEVSLEYREDFSRLQVLNQVAGTFGRAILELGSDDEGPSTEAHGPVIIKVLGQRSRNEVFAEIYMVWKTIFISRLLEPLEKQFVRMGVMTKVQAQGHMDALQLLRSLGKEVAMKFLLKFILRSLVRSDINLTLHHLLEPLEKQFLSLGVMAKVQAQRHMDDPAIIEVLGQRSRNEVLAEIYMVWKTIFFSRLLEPFEKQFLILGVMTKVQAQRHMDDLAIIEVIGQRSRNEVLAEIYMVWKTIFFSRLLEPLEKQFLRLGVMTKVQAQRHLDGPAIIEVLGQRSRNEVLAEIYMTIFFSRLLEPLEEQFLSLGVMTKVQAQRHMAPQLLRSLGKEVAMKFLLKFIWLSGNQFLFNLTLDVKFISDLDQSLIGTSFLLLQSMLSRTCSNANVGDWYHHLFILQVPFPPLPSQPMRKYSFDSYLVKKPWSSV